MASQDRTPIGPRREQRLAAALRRRHGLAPPIPIEDLAREYADIDRVELPAADGCVLGLTTLTRPRILLRTGRPSVRERFTLAHELGHIIIPWHLGHIGCHATMSTEDYDDDAPRSDESEANRFAAELLIPTDWLQGLVASDDSGLLAPIMERVAVANVSAHVAALGLLAVLPAGYVCALLDRHGTVEMSARSAGTIAPVPVEGERLDAAGFERFAVTAEAVQYRQRKIVWWTFRGDVPVGDVDADPRRASDVLASLAATYATAQLDAERLARRLNGITSYAYDQATKQGMAEEGELLSWLRSRFAGRNDLPYEIAREPDLDVYLRKRSRELAAKRRRRR